MLLQNAEITVPARKLHASWLVGSIGKSAAQVNAAGAKLRLSLPSFPAYVPTVFEVMRDHGRKRTT
jgi:hypothetical protein